MEYCTHDIPKKKTKQPSIEVTTPGACCPLAGAGSKSGVVDDVLKTYVETWIFSVPPGQSIFGPSMHIN